MPRRFLINKIVLTLSTLAAVVGIVFLFWILLTLTIKGASTLNLSVFTKDLVKGGIRNLLLGQFVMAGIASAIGIPLGMKAAIYLREYGRNQKLVNFIRNISDVMMSAPSIVIGVFVFALMVVPVNSFNRWAGSIALSLMMLPIIISTTDSMLSLVPNEMREAGMALGGSKHRVILDIVLKYAKVGITTGVLLAFARIIGETAPLLFTSANNAFLTMNLNDQFPSITVAIYNLANYPDQASRELAWTASFVLTMIVLFINLIGRFITSKKSKG